MGVVETTHVVLLSWSPVTPGRSGGLSRCRSGARALSLNGLGKLDTSPLPTRVKLRLDTVEFTARTKTGP